MKDLTKMSVKETDHAEDTAGVLFAAPGIQHDESDPVLQIDTEKMKINPIEQTNDATTIDMEHNDQLDLPKHTPGPREEVAGKENDGDVALNEENFQEPEILLFESKQLRSTEDAKKLVHVVDTSLKNEETIDDDKSFRSENYKASYKLAEDSEITREVSQRMAEEIVKVAELLINKRDFGRAKRKLENAQFLCPNAATEELLQKLLEIEMTDRRKAGKLLSLAKRMADYGELDLSEDFLLKAQDICPDSDILYDALFRVRCAKIKILRTKNSKRLSEIQEALEAETALEESHYAIAEIMLTELQNNSPNVNINEIISKINVARATESQELTGDDKAAVPFHDKPKQSSDSCLEIALKAIKSYDFDKAKEFLMLAEILTAHESAKYSPDFGENKTQLKEATTEIKSEQNIKYIPNAEDFYSVKEVYYVDPSMFETEELNGSQATTQAVKKEDGTEIYNGTENHSTKLSKTLRQKLQVLQLFCKPNDQSS